MSAPPDIVGKADDIQKLVDGMPLADALCAMHTAIASTIATSTPPGSAMREEFIAIMEGPTTRIAVESTDRLQQQNLN